MITARTRVCRPTTRMNFLIVEGNENMRRMLRVILSEFAGETHECVDGATAFAAYAEHRPDWVLMDLKMDGIDGLAATRQITGSFPGARVIVVSDYNDRDLRAAASAAGACEYMVKEDLHDLCRILRARAEASQPPSVMRSRGKTG